MRTSVRSLIAGAVVAAFTVAGPAAAQQQKIKIGFISTFSGPQGVMGQFMKESVDLAVEHLGGKVGGVPVEIVYGDDQFKPEVGVQVAEEMLKKQNVDFVSGIIWSNVMMAVVPVVTGAGKIMVGTNAGASPLAGSQCNKLYFSTSWNNDQTPEAMGKFLQDNGINDLYVMAPNYQAGKDMVAGLKRYYKGRIAEEVYTKMGQQDYQAEISQLRAKSPKAVFAFYPGGMGIQFLKQYDQAGLRDQIPLYTVYTVDEISIPAVKDAAVGIYETRYWSPDLKNPANEKFVGDYKKKYGKLPVFYGAQSYDGIMLIDSAVRAVHGNVKDTKGMVAAMEKANFKSLRGPFTYNVNHHPIQNFYLLKTEKTASGDIEMHIQKTIFEKHKDSYYQDCKMQ
jgi:branched-chain amino acid transport system substrate-binding protein